MENFFEWMVKVVPKDEVNVWFNIHNIHYERVELFGDIFKTLYYLILDTYLGYDISETKISLNSEDKNNHFEWCWNTIIENFGKEKIFLNNIGEHKDYLKSFFLETFYSSSEPKILDNIPKFINNVFDLEKEFSKSDLEILTEIYKILDKNIKW